MLAQDFKMGLPLVDGHGNFGSIEGDGAAAMRYTEARLQKITQEAFLTDMDKGVVSFGPNFDETEKEPEVLPARIPNLLVNGSEGIAVGMVTSIPPHNLGEVIDAVIALIKDSELSDEKLLDYIKGPDFPTGGIVINKDELKTIYQTGSGKIKIRGRVELEKAKGGKERLVITEIPYTMLGANIGKFLNDAAALAETKKTTDIVDISNQSSKDGNGKPETLSLRSILEHHIDFQFEIATKKYQNMLDKELHKKEIQEGLIRACDVIDLIIEILRGSQSQKQAKDCLVNGVTEGIKFKTAKSEKQAARLRFTEVQAAAILEMRLYKLIGLEIDALLAEHKQTLDNITRYEDILNNYQSMARVIIDELEGYKKEFGHPRKTSIENAQEIVLEEKKIEEFPVVFLMDRFGYARTIDESTYERNKEAADTENKVILHCMNTGKLCVFTDTGKQHLLKVLDVPYGKFRDKGTPIDNLCNYNSSEEAAVAVLPLEEVKSCELTFVTEAGFVKRVGGEEFDVSKRTIAATKLQEDDRVAAVKIADAQTHLVLRTKEDYLLRYPLEEIPIQKKAAMGVHGIKLGAKDKVAEAYFLDQEQVPEVEIRGKRVALNRLHIGKRDAKGSKVRGS